MPRRRILLLGVLLLLLGIPAPSAAQDDPPNEPMEEALFWLLLQQTNNALVNAIASSTEFDKLTDFNSAWAGIDTVLLEDGSTVPVDTAWLMVESDIALPELVLLQARVQALLEYQQSRGGLPPNSAEMLAELEHLLQQGRFQYDEEVPEPPPEPEKTNSLVNALGQLVLIVGGIVLVALLLIWLARNLQVQRASLENDLNGEDIPTSSDAATELAEQSRRSADYRAAIRYLYLSSLLLLDERGLINFDPSLTNFEHLRLVESQPQLFELLRPIVNIFDRVWYGFAPVDEPRYQKFVQLVDQIRQINA